MRYAIAYDVADDRRRQRVAKFLEGWGRRVQRSVFECELSSEELDQVFASLKELLISEEDICHLYRLCGERLLIGEELEKGWEGTLVL